MRICPSSSFVRESIYEVLLGSERALPTNKVINFVYNKQKISLARYDGLICQALENEKKGRFSYHYYHFVLRKLCIIFQTQAKAKATILPSLENIIYNKMANPKHRRNRKLTGVIFL